MDDARQFYANAFIWAVIVLLLLLGFSYWHYNQLGRITDSRSNGGVAEVVLSPGWNNHYHVKAGVNGVPVTFLLDTGASNIALPQSVAKQAGLASTVPTQVKTANGTTMGHITRVDNFTIGPIHLRHVTALIMGDKLKTPLLGMSALKQLEIIKRDGKLILRQTGSGRLTIE